jgi:hypothetical protein
MTPKYNAASGIIAGELLTPPPTNGKEISIFESEDEGEEDTVMDERKDNDEIIEDEVLSRLRRQEQEYLQD